MKKTTRLLTPITLALALAVALIGLVNPQPAKAAMVWMFNTGLAGWGVIPNAAWTSSENQTRFADDSGGAVSLGSGAIQREFMLVQSGTYKWYMAFKGQYPPQAFVSWEAAVGQSGGAMSMAVICDAPNADGWKSCYAQFNNLPATITTWKVQGTTGANYVDYIHEPSRLIGGGGPPGGGDPGDPGDPTATPGGPTATPMPTPTIAPTPGPAVGYYYDVTPQFSGGSQFMIQASMGSVSCSLEQNSNAVQCSGTFNDSGSGSRYAGLRYITTTVAVDQSQLMGFYMDVTYSKSASGEWYISLGNTQPYGQTYGDSGSGAKTERLCGVFADRQGSQSYHTYERIFEGVGCTATASSSSTNGSSISQWFDNDMVFGARGVRINQSWQFQISNVTFRSLSPQPSDEPPPDLSKMYGGSCASSFIITDTLTITDTNGITDTVQITDTVTVTYSASLVSDGSFEAADIWNQTTWQNSGPGYWDRIGPASAAGQYAWRYAHTGNYALWKTEYQDTGSNTQLCQTITIPDDTDFIRGGMAIIAGEGGSGSRSARLTFYQTFVSGSVSPNTSDPFAVAWQTVDGDRPVVQPTTAPFCVEIGSGAASIYVDSVFVYAMQGDPEDPELVCPPVPEDLIPPGAGGPEDPGDPEDPEDPEDPPPIVIPPPPGTGDPHIDLPEGLCVQCITPAGLNLHQWIAWLNCKIQNIVFCTLIVWYANVLNYTNGIFAWGRGFSFWLGFVLNYTLGWFWDVVQAFWNAMRLTLHVFWPNLSALFGNITGVLGVIVGAVDMIGGWSVESLMALVGWLGRNALGWWYAFLTFMAQRLIPWPLRFLWHWLQQAWPLIWEFLVYVGENAGSWLAWLIENWHALRQAAYMWFYNLFMSAIRAILESDFIQAIWNGIQFLVWLGQAMWEVIKVWVGRLLAIGNAVVDFLIVIWQMALQTVAALRADPFSTTEVFGHDTSQLSYTGQNETSILYLILIGVFIADSLLNITVAMVLVYVVIAAMSWGLIKWTLVQFTDLLPVS